MCGSACSRQAGFAQVTSVGRGGLPLRTAVPRVAARHLPLRDGHVYLSSRASGRRAGRVIVHGCVVQRSSASPSPAAPPTGGRRGLVLVVRVVGEPRPALGAQARAVVPAHRLERQCRAPPRRAAPARGRSGRPPAGWPRRRPSRRWPRVDEQLLDVHLQSAGRPGPGTARTPRRLHACGAGDQHALHHRLQPEVQLDRRPRWGRRSRRCRGPPAPATVSRTVIIAPARRPSRWVSRTSPERGSTGDAARLIADPPSRPVVTRGRPSVDRPSMLAAAAQGTKRAAGAGLRRARDASGRRRGRSARRAGRGPCGPGWWSCAAPTRSRPSGSR